MLSREIIASEKTKLIHEQLIQGKYCCERNWRNLAGAFEVLQNEATSGGNTSTRGREKDCRQQGKGGKRGVDRWNDGRKNDYPLLSNKPSLLSCVLEIRRFV